MHDWNKLKRGFAGLRRKGKRLFGILGNQDGLINVPERPGYQYARVERGAERVTLVCKGNARPRLNTAVIIEQHPITGEFEIVELDVFTTQAAGDDPATSLFDVRAHAASHEWREDADDMLLWLHPNQFYFLRVQPGETSGHVIVQGGPYFVGGKIQWKREQSDVDLNPYYPASGSAWVMLCLDAADAVTVVQAPDAADAEELEDLGNVPLGTMAVAAVRLTDGAEIDFFGDIIPLWQVSQLDASVLGNGVILIQDTQLVVDLLGTYPSYWGEWASIGQVDLCGKTFFALQTRWDSDFGFFGVLNEGDNRKDTVILFGDDGTGVDESIRDRFVVYGYGTYGESEELELRAFLTINQDGSIEPYDGATFDGVDVSEHATDEAAHHSRYTDTEAQAVADAQIATHTADDDAHHARYTDAEALSAVESGVHAATGKTTPVDADETLLLDSADSYGLARLTWANLKATLQAFFDTLYNLYVHPNHSGEVTSDGDGATTIANKQTLTAAAPLTISNAPTVIASAAPQIAVDAAGTDAPGVVELATDAEVAAATSGVLPTAPQLPLYRQANGALQADTGGNARGAYAVDLQIVRSDDAQVAGGAYAIVQGLGNTAGGDYAGASGYGNVADGDYARALGRYSQAYGLASLATGHYSKAELIGELAHASGRFAANGDAQYRRFVLRGAYYTLLSTWLTLYNAASESLTIPSNTLWNFDVKLVGLTGGAAQRWVYDVRGSIVNDGGTVTLLESSVTTRYESDATYEAQVAAGTSSLDVQVRRTGGTAYTVRWVAVVEVVQVTY